MILPEKTRALVERRSKVGRMFTESRRLSALGKNPIDLMLGNPNEKPNSRFYDACDLVLARLRAETSHNPHRYMANIGFPETREVMAAWMTQRTGLDLASGDILMTVGCANGLDVCFVSLLEPGDEVVTLTPGFMEYMDYIRLNRGRPVLAPMTDEGRFDFDCLDRAITKKTRALILNYPNNPTGQIMAPDELRELAAFLNHKNQKIGHEIVVLEDSPYDQICFGTKPTPMLCFYPHTIYLTSFSKGHGLGGERIGFMAIHPELGEPAERSAFRTLLANNLRFRVVNAPGFMQRVLALIGGEPTVNVAAIEARIRMLERGLRETGYRFKPADGGFFIFAAIPESTPSLEAWQALASAGQEPLLAVHGPLFGGERYDRFLRFSVTVPDSEIARAVRRLHEMHDLS